MQNTSSAVMQQRAEPRDGPPIITLDEARAAGLRWYFTGQPCPKGHLAKRTVSNRECRRCVDERAAKRRAENPEAVREKDRAKYHAAGDRKREQMRASRSRRIEEVRAKDRERYYQNPERYKIAALKWGRENKGKHNAMVAARRAAQKQATPPWLTAEQHKAMRAFYVEAAAREGEWHVDHIHPIKGRLSCGLHVPWNLQLLTGDENRKKGNSYVAE